MPIYSKEAFNQASHERKIINSLNHDNILKACDAYDFSSSEIGLALPFMKKGSLYKYALDKQSKTFATMTVEKKQQIALGITAGISYLHDQHIVHRDMKPHNILLDDHLTPKIADFGTALKIPEDKEVVKCIIKGTPIYFPPEYGKYREKASVSYSVDRYAFALICIELFKDLSIENILYRLEGAASDFSSSHAITFFNPYFSTKQIQIPLHHMHSDLLDLLKSLTSKEAVHRPELCAVEKVLSKKDIFQPITIIAQWALALKDAGNKESLELIKENFISLAEKDTDLKKSKEHFNLCFKICLLNFDLQSKDLKSLQMCKLVELSKKMAGFKRCLSDYDIDLTIRQQFNKNYKSIHLAIRSAKKATNCVRLFTSKPVELKSIAECSEKCVN